ncbi:MAG: FAD-binding protein [Arenimonas sp.]|uniref:lycopene cyclase family protein n=1 Tax=Arenimonas sp. TaxID=1872635 RepID=UPI0025BEADF0|nr:lycopene cyclase family protein [Arenimonas sp.]MBW8368367.1 FAD-binding protein [Arenimonas sp.]
MNERANLVVIGGGLAGLSLATRLARGGYRGRVVIIEPREEYTDDRSWSFWTRADQALPVAAARHWSHWRFSRYGGDPVTHSAQGWRYSYVRSSDLYREALAVIQAQPNFKLVTGTRAGAVEHHDGAVSVVTGAATFSAPFVIDTRPPAAARFSDSTLFQCFAGRELRFGPACLDDRQVELMTDMRSDALGFVFSYVLPLSPTRALVEATRFSTRPLGQAQLSADLDQMLASRGWSDAQVMRTEAAVLPMGLPAPDASVPIPGVVQAGMGAGALRAASGFGFVRIQAWAERCARELLQGRPPVGHPAEPKLQGWMDRVFLRALANNPERSPEFFLRLAASVPGEAFVRFMSDRGGWRDHARIIAALPPWPFLQALHASSLRPGPST